MAETTVQGDEPMSDELDDLIDDPDLLRPAPQAWRARTAVEMIVSGVLAAIWPARRAAKLDVLEALAYE